MFGKRIAAKVLFIILVCVSALTAAVLVRSSMAGARESRTAFIRKEAV